MGGASPHLEQRRPEMCKRGDALFHVVGGPVEGDNREPVGGLEIGAQVLGCGVQKRKKLLQAEPWSDPSVDEAQSNKAAGEFEEALKAL